jgi:hypothetical protein
MRAILAAGTGLLIGLFAQTSAALDVDTCGAAVPVGAEAHLISDVICPADAPVAVSLGRDAALHLDGFAIEGGRVGVDCERACAIFGPGEIRGQSLSGVGGRTVAASGITVHSTQGGIANGITARTLDIVDSVVRDCAGIGVSARRMNAVNLTVQRSGLHGLQVRRLAGTGMLVEDNGGRGVSAQGPIELTGLIARRNQVGIWSRRGSVRLADSEITQSGAAPSFDQNPDVIASRLPVLTNTVCGRSQVKTTAQSWGVCQND